MESIPLISFITVNYNGLKDTIELIDSLQKAIHSVSYEILVVDNASKQNEAEIIQSQYSWILTIRSEENLGFAGGNNLGIQKARGKYIFLINNDTYLKDDGIKALIERIESSTSIAAVSPKLRFAFPPQDIQFAGFTPMTSITLRNKSIGFGHIDDGTFDTPHSTPYLHGAAMMIKREVIDRIGLMPEMYFLYYEELDWCNQMTRAGYQLWYEPRCTVFHKESQSTGQTSPLRTFYMTRNRLLFAQRNLRCLYRILSIIYQIAVAIPKNIIVFLLKRQRALACAAMRGELAFFTLLLKN